MRKGEWLLVAFVYLCLLIGGLAIIRALRANNEGLAVALPALMATQLAAYLYHRRAAEGAPAGLRLLLGLMLAAIALVCSSIAQWRWQILALPEVVIPIDVIGTAITPFVLMNVLRKGLPRTPPVNRPLPPLAISGVAIAARFRAGFGLFWATRSAGKENALIQRTLPGLTISTPNWHIAANNGQRYERGEFKLDAPEGYDRAITLRWETGDVPDEILDAVWRDGGMTPGPKEHVAVGGHDGLRQLISSASKRVYVTTWRCPEDGRWLCLMTFLDQPADRLLALHESMLASVHCHTQGPRKPRPPQYATFTPPPGWQSAPKEVDAVAYVSPAGDIVVISQSTAGRHEMLGTTVPDDAIAAMLKSMFTLKAARVTQRQTISDPHGAARTVWSLSATHDDGSTAQMELMGWYCNKSDESFLVFYLSENPHTIADAVGILLRADCP